MSPSCWPCHQKRTIPERLEPAPAPPTAPTAAAGVAAPLAAAPAPMNGSAQPGRKTRSLWETPVKYTLLLLQGSPSISCFEFKRSQITTWYRLPSILLLLICVLLTQIFSCLCVKIISNKNICIYHNNHQNFNVVNVKVLFMFYC